MARLETRVPTVRAGRYLQQLCKHWSHRFPVAFDPGPDCREGSVRMTGAECRFRAGPEALEIVLEGEDAAALPRLGEVVADHLRRFAFREELAIDWRGPSAA